MRLISTVSGLVLAVISRASGSSEAVDREINGLLAALESSGCEFNRNNVWHEGGRAAGHLRRKYDYLRKQKKIARTEVFIELAATRSSMSGDPYLVRLPGGEPIESRRWFLARLAGLRAEAAKRRRRY